MPRRTFYPAFQGSAFRLHCLTATASRPFQSGVGCLARKIPRTPSSRIKVFLCFSIKLDAFSFLAYNLIYQRELWKKVFTESCLLTRIALRCKIRNSCKNFLYINFKHTRNFSLAEESGLFVFKENKTSVPGTRSAASSGLSKGRVKADILAYTDAESSSG